MTAGSVPSLEPPPDGLVWHYTDGNGLISILRNQVLWATASGHLNDAQEVELGRQLLVRRFTELADGNDPLFTELRSRLEKGDTHREPTSSWFFILSASRAPDSLAMWRSYGGRGESYAIGLDPTARLTTLVEDAAVVDDLVIHQRGWTPVRYDTSGQADLVDSVYAAFATEVRNVMAMRREGHATTRQYVSALERTLDAAEQALVLIKHEGFREEQESRHSTVIVGDGDGARVRSQVGIAHFRHGPYGMTPFVALTGRVQDAGREVATIPGALPIGALMVSPSPTGGAGVDSVAALLASVGMPQVPVHRSRIPYRD